MQSAFRRRLELRNATALIRPTSNAAPTIRDRISPASRGTSQHRIQRLTVAQHGDHPHASATQAIGQDVRRYLGEAVALQHDAAADAQDVGQRQQLADRPRPARHALEREHEARQHHRGSSENCASCCACCCVRAMVENVIPSARLPAMNTPSASQQHQQRAAHRHVERQRGDATGSAAPARSPARHRARSCPASPRSGAPASPAGSPWCRTRARG